MNVKKGITGREVILKLTAEEAGHLIVLLSYARESLGQWEGNPDIADVGQTYRELNEALEDYWDWFRRKHPKEEK